MSSPHDEAGPSSPPHDETGPSSPPHDDGPIDTAPATRVRRRRRRTGRPNPFNVNPVEQAQDVDGQILFLTPEEHIIGLPVEERESFFELRSHKREIVIDNRIDGRLQKLGLIHISKVKHVNADIALLKALVEFWRPETHTFHFPVGEMTVTLQDVKYLYGLRTVGKPVTGSTTRVQFDDQVSAQLFATANWAREKRGNRRSIRLKWLRENCSNWPPVGASDDELDRYTRAVAMELFGTLMFPDILQDSVPAFLLDLVAGNLNEDKYWNWGGAVLACLYHSLDRAALRFKVVTGPWMLLLFWAWSYISVCRPSLPDDPFPGFGQPDIDSCPPFGRKFAEGRSFSKNTHRGAVEYARDHLATLEVEDINWLPYRDDRQRMPRVAQLFSASDYVRMPVIFYHIVAYYGTKSSDQVVCRPEDTGPAYYYPERCRRQFGLYQLVPPPLPLSWHSMRNYINFERNSFANPDWSSIFHVAHAAWSDEALAALQVDLRPWTDADSLRYFRWFWRWGGSELPTPREQAEARIRRRGDVPISQRQYAPMGSKLRNTGNSALKNAVHAISLLVKKGCRRIGKAILMNCRSQLQDASMPLRIEDLLEQRGL
ncbi:hypothetical protein LUZ61_011392 [Rhynchospora tenuis]|uniref:Aminotransferase-like plant mobile domain-containing protein n=1 Tax=Rhynchospora tenuis TaxID=198213 RepID=A0AAD6A0Y9_9POAL|nr:hypothetical protein LUZ61_011392 [Rhynchospora tenuis]